MSLAIFPTRRGALARAIARPRFRLGDEVRLGGDARIAHVTGLRAPRPHSPEVLIVYPDGGSRWVAEGNLRAARAKLELLQGGAHP